MLKMYSCNILALFHGRKKRVCHKLDYPGGFNVLDVVNEPFGNYTSTGGQFYVGTRVNADVVIWKENKKDPSFAELEFAGFENIMTAMTREMGTYLKEGFARKK